MKKVILSFGIITSMVIISFGQNTVASDAKTNPNAPEITFAEVVHDFGVVQKGDDCTYEFKFKNTGKEPLILSNCQSSCGCTAPHCPKEPIAPGGSAFIKVKYDSNRIGIFNKTVTVTSNAKNSPVTLTIKGNVEGPAQEEVFPGKNNSGMGQ